MRDGAPESGPRRPSLGLRLFHGDDRGGYRRRRRFFVAVWATVTVALTVPVVPAVWSARPLIFGLPTSLAWVIVCLAVVFAALVWLYLGEVD